MNTQENQNFNKVTSIFDVVNERLRYIFEQEWNKQHPNAWKDNDKSLHDLKMEAQTLNTFKKLKSTFPISGDRNKWGIKILFNVLLNSNTINLSSKNRKLIENLKDKRDAFFHACRASIDNTKFEAICQDIKTYMIGLNCSASEEVKMEDIQNGIIKLPEVHLKEVGEKINVILILMSLASLLISVLLCSYLYQSSHTLDLSSRTTCNNSHSFFPESLKPRYFIGHDDEINTGVIVLANGSYRMISITGPPAIGKTATAIAVANVLRNNHSYQVAFVDFKHIDVNSSHIRTDIYRDIVLSIGDWELKNVPNSMQEFKMLMKKIRCPTLLVFDNIENILNSTSKSIFDEVTNLCLAINKIKILTTSRKEFDIIGVPIHTIKLEPLTKSQSTALLFELLAGFLQRSSVETIAEKTGGIPLLLEVAASLVRSKYYEKAEILKRFRELPTLTVLNDTKDMTESSNYYLIIKNLFDGFDECLQYTFMAFGTIPMIVNHTRADSLLNFIFSEKVDLYPLLNYNMLKTLEMPSGEIVYRMHPIITEFTILVHKYSHWPDLRSTHLDDSFILETKFPKCKSFTIIMGTKKQLRIWKDSLNVPTFLVNNGITERDEAWLFAITLRIVKEAHYTKSKTALFQTPVCPPTKDDDNQVLQTLNIFEITAVLLQTPVCPPTKDDNNQLLQTLKSFAVNATEKYLKETSLSLNSDFRNLWHKTLNLIGKDPCVVINNLFKLAIFLDNTMLYNFTVCLLNNTMTYQQQYEQQHCSKKDLEFLAFEIGITFFKLRRYHESINVLIMLDNLPRSHVKKLAIDCILADSYYQTQDNEASFKVVQRVLNSSYEFDYRKLKLEFQTLIELAIKAANQYESQRNFSMAMQFGNLSLNTLNMLETDSCLDSSDYYNIGVLFLRLNNCKNAVYALNQTWKFRKQNKCNEETLGNIATLLGTAYYYCGQYNDSIDVLRIAIDLLEKDSVHQIVANDLLVSSYYGIQEHENCYQITRNFLSNNSYLCTLNTSVLHKPNMINLARFAEYASIEYSKKYNFNQSIVFLNLSIATFEVVDPESCHISILYATRAVLLNNLHRYADSQIAINKSLKLRQRKWCDNKYFGVINMQHIHFLTGQQNESIEVLIKQIDLWKGNPDYQFLCNYMFVIAYYNIGEYDKSFQLIRKALDSSYNIDQVDHLKFKKELEILNMLARKHKLL